MNVNTTPIDTRLMGVAEAAAESLLGVLQLLTTPIPTHSKLHKCLEEIRRVPIESTTKDFAKAEIQVDVNPEEVENPMNSEEANKCLRIAITALSANNLQKAEQYLAKFNNLYPTNQVKMILDNNMIQLKISQMPKAKDDNKTPDPDMWLVDRLIDIACKAMASKDFSKAQDFLTKAEKVKQTPKAQKLLENVKQDKHKQQTVMAVKLVECAMNAIDDNQYDVAELLLKTAWIKYHSVLAKKSFDILNQGTHRGKQLCEQTEARRIAATDRFVKLAESFISEGYAKVAESILIIVYYLVSSNDQRDKVNKLLGFNGEWKLCHYCNGKYSHVIVPRDSIASYKAYYYVTMAYRAFEYADNPKLALEFLNEADRIYPNSEDIKKYIERVIKSVN